MDTIIDTLLEIDRNAREMVENAAKQRESSVSNLADIKKEIDMTAMNEARAKVEDYRQKLKAETDKLKTTYTAAYETNRAALENTYNAGCSTWVDSIVENCTQAN